MHAAVANSFISGHISPRDRDFLSSFIGAAAVIDLTASVGNKRMYYEPRGG
jgi:hypothetical protein